MSRLAAKGSESSVAKSQKSLRVIELKIRDVFENEFRIDRFWIKGKPSGTSSRLPVNLTP